MVLLLKLSQLLLLDFLLVLFDFILHLLDLGFVGTCLLVDLVLGVFDLLQAHRLARVDFVFVSQSGQIKNSIIIFRLLQIVQLLPGLLSNLIMAGSL